MILKVKPVMILLFVTLLSGATIMNHAYAQEEEQNPNITFDPNDTSTYNPSDTSSGNYENTEQQDICAGESSLSCVPYSDLLPGDSICKLCPDSVKQTLAEDVDIQPKPGVKVPGGAGGYEIFAPVNTPTVSCSSGCGICLCGITIEANHTDIRNEISSYFRDHRTWMIDTYFYENIAFAMAAMTNQMNAVAMQQMKIIGTFFDAKHQLETQRLFQQLMAEAHKDYQPSEGMCDIATTARGLITANKKSDLTQMTLANRILQRQLRSGDNLAINANSDFLTRALSFKQNFCNITDNVNGLFNMCAGVSAPRETRNKDVDYTRTVESQLTMDVDFGAYEGKDANVTADEKSAFALMANLFANVPLPQISRRTLADDNGIPRVAAYNYLDLRAVAAKRSVATNSLSAIIAERASGDGQTAAENAKFIKSTIKELGVPEDEIEFILGKNPSYFAQMEVLTKKLYQNPVFYTELYDKPSNVLRKRAAIRAIGLMQDRDYYKSVLRNEAVLSVLLESMLSAEHDRVFGNLNRLSPDGEVVRK